MDTMPEQMMTSIDPVTADWLTAVLVRSNALTHGSVAAFDVDTGVGNWSTNARLTVRYTDEAQGSLPRRLFLKMVNTNPDGESFDASEVTYYGRDYVDVEDAPLLRCYDAMYSEELGRYHILLDDVSETHVNALPVMTWIATRYGGQIHENPHLHFRRAGRCSALFGAGVPFAASGASRQPRDVT